MIDKKFPIHVAFFSHDANLKGGGSISLLNLLDNLPHDKVKCFVFLPGRSEFSTELEKRSIDYAILPNRWWVSYNYSFEDQNIYRSIKSRISYYKKALGRAYDNIKALPTYIKLIKKHKIDVIYTNTSVIFMGALTAALLQKPHIWHIREYKGLDFRFDFGSRVFYFFLRKSKAKIFVSEALRRQYPKFAAHPSTFVVHNGIPAPQNSNSYKKDKETFTFCIVGKLTASKGQEVAIEALSYLKKVHPKIRLILAGSGKSTYTVYLKEMAHRLDVDENVTFLGQVDDPYRVYGMSDVYLMCSSNETFGRVTVEAMLAKLPVIGFESELTGTKEIVEDGLTGFLYRGGAKELFDRMKYLVEHPEILIKMGEHAHKQALHKFGVNTYANKLESIIRHVLS